MISRRTIFSLVLALLIFFAIRAWWVQHPDNCQRYLAGDKSFPPVQYVKSGSYMIPMDCRWWLPRQPTLVQAACLLDMGNTDQAAGSRSLTW
jgi:hypothetical protein